MDKVVIFAHHREVIEGLREGLRDYGAVSIYGKTPVAKRQQRVDSFQENPRTRVFVGQLDAAGTNLTLTAANQVVMVEESWVPGVNRQCIDRCRRIGQDRGVRARFFCLAGSLDEPISSTNRRKTEMQAALYD